MFMLDSSHFVQNPYTTECVLYTPELAKEILDSHNTHNRKISPATVALMCAEILADTFLLTHQGVAFAEDGTLLDGQHRLDAVVKSGKSVVLMTTFGLSRKAQAAIDNHRKRTEAELLKFGCDINVERKVISTAKSMMRRGEPVKCSINQLCDFIEDNQEALRISFSVIPINQRGGTSGIRGCVARAAYNCDEETLLSFGAILRGSGAVANGQQAANHLGRMMVDGRKLLDGSDGYAYCQTALLYFINGVEVEHLRPLFGNHFPLPGESADPLPIAFKRRIAAATNVA